MKTEISSNQAQSTEIPSWMREAFAVIDRRDAAGFARLMTEDGIFRFGNGPAAIGRPAIESAVAQFFASLGGISHQLERAWSLPDAQALQGVVTYTRPDGKSFKIPFMDAFVTDKSGLVKEWLVYSDMAPLFS